MTELARISIPRSMFEFDTHTQTIVHLGLELEKSTLDKAMLLYCGVEGMDLENIEMAEDLPTRNETFGVTWDELAKDAEEYDKYGGSGTYDYPVVYAMEGDSPAIVAYDSDSLRETHFHLWAPRNENTLSAAARALILITQD